MWVQAYYGTGENWESRSQPVFICQAPALEKIQGFIRLFLLHSLCHIVSTSRKCCGPWHGSSINYPSFQVTLPYIPTWQNNGIISRLIFIILLPTPGLKYSEMTGAHF
ncbi:hypothetical protein XELAEV_18046096mg [Xenopus laevis]|uniref:Uncharacterized protein n=1 Tax=Xenopus laevis TaxID=8355 RepID=A0A974H0L9_XENLA|nr:hypothetical protein XELAEV_18046096mg [Xenopus laevis]